MKRTAFIREILHSLMVLNDSFPTAFNKFSCCVECRICMVDQEDSKNSIFFAVGKMHSQWPVFTFDGLLLTIIRVLLTL